MLVNSEQGHVVRKAYDPLLPTSGRRSISAPQEAVLKLFFKGLVLNLILNCAPNWRNTALVAPLHWQRLPLQITHCAKLAALSAVLSAAGNR